MGLVAATISLPSAISGACPAVASRHAPPRPTAHCVARVNASRCLSSVRHKQLVVPKAGAALRAGGDGLALVLPDDVAAARVDGIDAVYWEITYPIGDDGGRSRSFCPGHVIDHLACSRAHWRR